MVQLTLIVFFILVIPLVVIISYTGTSTLQYTKDEIAANSLETIELNRRYTENFMDNISASIHRLAFSHDFFVYDGLQMYSSIQGNVENGMRIERLQRELQSIVRSNDAIASVFFLFEDGDYVISTDRGIVELTDYSGLSWLRAIPSQRRGLSGAWIPREHQLATIREIIQGQEMGYYIPVISYVYSLSRLTTAIRGTIVANVRENSVANNLNPGLAAGRTGGINGHGIIILQADGRVISHPLSENFIIQGRSLPHIAAIVDSEKEKGYEFIREGGTQYLYTWLKTDYFNWIYVSVQSIDTLLGRSNLITRTMVILSLIVVFFGTLSSLIVFFWISKPMRLLVKNLRENVVIGEKATRNEIDFLSSAFTQIESKEKQLKNLLNEREKDAALQAMRNFISGDSLSSQETEILEQVFPHNIFRLAFAVLDNYEEYRRRTNAQERAYHRLLFISGAEKIPGFLFTTKALHLMDAQIALIINKKTEIKTEKILPFLKILQGTAREIFGTSVTIGLSESGFGFEVIQQCARQASEAVTMRMLQGSNSIICWKYKEGNKRFYYPMESEGRILNYLGSGDLRLIIAELEEIQRKIQSNTGIGYDNIYFIYNQLAGVTIKHLSETNIHTSSFIFSHENVYKTIASCETLEQLNSYMGNFYGEIITYLKKEVIDEQPVDRILSCLAKHFRDDIFFEDIAAELGMSYSYMRRIVKRATGKSVNEIINFRRIQEAKTLLLNGKLPPDEIAKMVGYRNPQSLKRYFKKFEGLNFHDYRLVKTLNSQ